MLAAGLVSALAAFLIGERLVWQGEDVIEPLAALAGTAVYAVAANACYSLGWITELLWSGGDVTRTAPLRIRVFRIGLFFSVGVTLLPAVLVPALWAIFGFRHGPRP